MTEKEVDLQECRKRIDAIDDQIIRLFEERMEISGEIAGYKIRTGKPVFDPEREAAVIEGVRRKTRSDFNADGAAELFRKIMEISRKRQHQLMEEAGHENGALHGQD